MNDKAASFRGAAGVHEAIYCLLMLRDGFIAGSANIDNLDPGAEGYPIVREGVTLYSNPLPHVLVLTAIVVGVATTCLVQQRVSATANIEPTSTTPTTGGGADNPSATRHFPTNRMLAR